MRLKATALLCCAIGVLGCRHLTRQAQTPWRNWRPPPVVLPDPNAHDLYLKAFELKEETDEKYREPPDPNADPFSQPYVPPEHWWDTGPEDLSARERLELYADVLRMVREAFPLECRLPPPEGVDTIGPTHRVLTRSYEMASVFGMEAHVHVEDGKPAAAAASALDCMEMGNDLLTARIDFALLSHRMATGRGVRALQEAVPGLSATDCREALERLERLEADRVPLAEIVDGHEVWTRTAFKEIIADPRKLQYALELWFEDQNPPDRKPEGPMDLFRAWAELDQFFGELRLVAEQPYYERAEVKLPENIPARTLTYPWKRMWAREASSRAAFAVAKAQLAARLYLLEEGHLPSDLGDLVPRYLPEVPTDPFDPGALRTKTAEGTLIIYSIGPDGLDDGGKHKGFCVGHRSKGDMVVKVAATD